MKKLIYISPLALILLLTGNANAQTAAADNKISESITYNDPPKGKGLFGIFEGRSPCAQINKLIGANLPADLDHLKWQVIFYRDSVTLKPTTFSLITEMFDRKPMTGKWTITHGAKNNPTATIYALDWGQPGKVIHLLKGDENVLFVLDENLEFMTGDADFSYTLNRVNKVLHLSKE